MFQFLIQFPNFIQGKKCCLSVFPLVRVIDMIIHTLDRKNVTSTSRLKKVLKCLKTLSQYDPIFLYKRITLTCFNLVGNTPEVNIYRQTEWAFTLVFQGVTCVAPGECKIVELICANPPCGLIARCEPTCNVCIFSNSSKNLLQLYHQSSCISKNVFLNMWVVFHAISMFNSCLT